MPPPAEKSERRSFNLKTSTLRLLDEVPIKTMRDGRKWTLSAIDLMAKEMVVSVETDKRVKATVHKGVNE